MWMSKVSAFVPAEEQPYAVPGNWVWTRIETLSSVISKGTTPTGGKDAYKDSGIGFLRVENILENGIIDNESLKYIDEQTHNSVLKRSILAERDVLVSIAGTLGRTAIVREENLPLNTNQAVAFIRLISKDLNEVYIEKALSSPKLQEMLLAQTKVTSIPNLTLEIIKNIPIPIPPIPEQHRIVARIESRFTKLDRAKELAQSALDSFETRKAAILHKAFTGELTEKWREEHGVGLESWEEKSLGEVFDMRAGKFIEAKMIFQEDNNARYPCFGGNGVRGYVDNYNTEGDFPLIGRQGALCGNINMASGKFCATEHAVIVKPKTDTNVFWAFHMLNKLNLNQYSTATAQPGLAVSKISGVSFLLPSLPEQTEIVRILDSLFEKEQRARELCGVIEKIDLMKKAILARAFRGELGTNDPGEERVVGLVEEI